MEIYFNSAWFSAPWSQDIQDHVDKHGQQHGKAYISTEVQSQDVLKLVSLILFFSSNYKAYIYNTDK